jgi:membrane protease YdiL (CAAX protease family)
VIRLRNGVDALRLKFASGSLQLGRDLRATGAEIWHNRSVQIVLLLAIIPWVASIAYHRDPNVWMPLAQIVGLVVVYWFFTRGQTGQYLPVRRPLTETGLALILTLLWILYRVVEYLRLWPLAFPRCPLCGDMTDTLAPKMVEMFILPLVLFLLLRYSLAQLGLGLPVRAWIPALAPIVVLVVIGLSHQKPQDLLTHTFCFYLGAGLPEELLFRGLLQSRLEFLTKRPVWGLFLGAFIFGVTHIPIDLHGLGWQHWEVALESAFTYQMSVGLALGYAFQRSRNLWPLTLLHALIDAAP